MSRLKRTLSAVVLVLLVALGFAPAAHASEPTSPRLAIWEHVWSRLAALWEVPVSRWLGGRPTVEKIGSGIDPDGAPAPTNAKQGSDIGSGIDPNG
jgi:hypothetical protein